MLSHVFETFAQALEQKDIILKGAEEAQLSGDERLYRAASKHYREYMGMVASYFNQIRKIEAKEKR